MQTVFIKTLSHFSNILAMTKEDFDKLFPEPIDTKALSVYIQENILADIHQEFLTETVVDVSEYNISDATELYNAYNGVSWSEDRLSAFIENA